MVFGADASVGSSRRLQRSPRLRRLPRSWFARLVLLLAVAVPGVFAAQDPAAAVVSGTPDPAVQTDGRVDAVLRVGDRVYFAGNFLNVNGVPRTRLAAVDANTGALLPWNPTASGHVFALAASPDGRRIYAGGSFAFAGGTAHNRLAAFDAATGRVDDSWSPRADSTVRTIGVLGERVYVGGDFLSVNGQARSRLAALDRSGALISAWNPGPNGTVRKLKISGDGGRVYVGGTFTGVSGGFRRNLAALDTISGVRLPWRPNPSRPIIDLTVSGSRVFTAEGGAGGAVGAYDTVTGVAAWSVLADGDAQAVAVHGDRLYVGGHFDALAGRTRLKLAALLPATGALDPLWAPRTNLGVRVISGDPLGRKLYVGGDFTMMNGQPRRGFASFSGL